MKTTADIRLGAEMTLAQRQALRSIGFSVEERGGDPTRSTFRNARVPRTVRWARVSRRDGAAMTASDVAAAKAVL